MSLSDATLLSKVSIGISIVGLIFAVIGFSTDNWITVSGTIQGEEVSAHSGLFKECGNVYGVDGCVDMPSGLLPSWFVATRVMVILGVVVELGGMGILVVYVVVKNDLKTLQLASLGHTFVAAALVLVGIIIYGAKRHEIYPDPAHLGWSFALTVVGGLIFLINGVVLVVDKLRIWKK